MSAEEERELLSAALAVICNPVVAPDVSPSYAPFDRLPFPGGCWGGVVGVEEWVRANWRRDRRRAGESRADGLRGIARGDQWSKPLGDSCGRRRHRAFGITCARARERLEWVALLAHCPRDLSEPVDLRGAAQRSNLRLMGSNSVVTVRTSIS